MKIIKLTLSILIPLFIGGFSGMLTAGEIPTWYTTLQRPSFSPPNAVFGPVWTLLYLLMGISFYRIWIRPELPFRTRAMVLFGIQLVLNFFWSLIFFRWPSIGLALVEILLLWATLLGMIIVFNRVDKTAARMNIPYLLWVSFATVLNSGYFWLNR